MKIYFFQNMCPFPKIRTSNQTNISFLAEQSANKSYNYKIIKSLFDQKYEIFGKRIGRAIMHERYLLLTEHYQKV